MSEEEKKQAPEPSKEEKKPEEKKPSEEKKEESKVAEPKKEEAKPSEKEKQLQEEVEKLKKEVFEKERAYEEADKKADDWKNKYYQVYADMANTRKQVERENADFKKYAQQSLIEEMIPTFDSFDMALKSEPKDETIKKYLEGFEMIHNKLLYALKQNHVEIIDPKVGEAYDASFMQAFSTIPGKEDNKVAETFTKGYKLYDHLLRPAGVIITKKEEVKVEEKKEAEKPEEKEKGDSASEKKVDEADKKGSDSESEKK